MGSTVWEQNTRKCFPKKMSARVFFVATYGNEIISVGEADSYGNENFKRKWPKSVFYFYFGTKNMGNGLLLAWFL